jgi:hypothetical protein
MMKLLLENWKRYIKEELRPEDYEDFPQKENEEAEAYLGNPKEIGEFIYRAFREELEKRPDETEAQLWSDRITSDANSKIRQKYPNVKYLGKGVFRTAFTLNKDLIIKVNTSYTTDSGQLMNKEDFTLSRDPKTSKIFPKVYSHDPDFNWIVMDLVHPILSRPEFMTFFPNKNIDKQPAYWYYKELYNMAMLHKVGEITGDKQMIGNAEAIYDGTIKIHMQSELNKSLSLKEIISGFDQTFFQVCNAVAKYGIRMSEIRPNNTGFTVDESGNKQFVILDSSIDASIKKAFGEPDLKKQAPPAQMNVGVTAPPKK